MLGDARLTLAASPSRYDVIVLDAFSSDAIPVHLLTREAFAGYLSRLEKDGVIVMHISNRHMELDRVVAAVGAAEGLVSYIKQDNRPEILHPDSKSNAIVVALTRDPANLGNLPEHQTAQACARSACPCLDRRLLRYRRCHPAQEAWLVAKGRAGNSGRPAIRARAAGRQFTSWRSQRMKSAATRALSPVR